MEDRHSMNADHVVLCTNYLCKHIKIFNMEMQNLNKILEYRTILAMDSVNYGSVSTVTSAITTSTTKPTTPTNLTNPTTNPTNPAKLVNNMNSPSPVKTSNPLKPTNLANYFNCAFNPANLANPAHPFNPSHLVNLLDPTNPFYSFNPTNPLNPFNSADPLECANPFNPYSPINPLQPQIFPATPFNPANPFNFGNPFNIVKPLDSDLFHPPPPAHHTNPTTPIGHARPTNITKTENPIRLNLGICPIRTITVIINRKMPTVCNFCEIGEILAPALFNINLCITKSINMEIELPNNVQNFQLCQENCLTSAYFVNLPDQLKQLNLTESCRFYSLDLPNFPPHLSTFHLPNIHWLHCIIPLLSLPPTLQELRSSWADVVPRPPLPLLPPNLKILKLDLRCNKPYQHPIDNFPPSLEHLQLLGDFTHSLGNLPASLKILEFGALNGPLCSLPVGLESLSIVDWENPTPLMIPDSVKRFTVEAEALHETFHTSLPCNLQVLQMEEVVTLDRRLLDNLPPLAELILPKALNSPIGHLPDTLLKLQFGREFNQPLCLLPDNLQELVFRGEFGFPYAFAIKFNQPLENLPANLREIRFEGSSLYNLPFVLPPQLEVLQLVHVNEKVLADFDFKRRLYRYTLFFFFFFFFTSLFPPFFVRVLPIWFVFMLALLQQRESGKDLYNRGEPSVHQRVQPTVWNYPVHSPLPDIWRVLPSPRGVPVNCDSCAG
jgi:hypothetical protein